MNKQEIQEKINQIELQMQSPDFYNQQGFQGYL